MGDLGRVPTRCERSRRRRARWTSRLIVGLVLLLGLTLVAPSGELPVNLGPLSWSWSALLGWLPAPLAWADPTPSTPKQESGSAKGLPHKVPTSATRAGVGVGNAPGKGVGQVDAAAAQRPAAKTGKSGPVGDENSFDPKTSRKVAGSSTALDDVYLNADGSYTRTSYQTPVNYQAADGSWQRIDPTLVLGKDGRYHETANSLGVDIASWADDPAVTTQRFPSGQVLSYGLAGAGQVPATAGGTRVTFAGVLASTDLQIDATNTGVKETLVLTSAAAPTQWVFPLTLQGLTARISADGAVEYVDTNGVVVSRTPPGYMTDSNYNPQSGEPAQSNAVHYELTTVNGQPALVVSVDAAWVADPARMFPIKVDPTGTYTNGASTYAETTNPGNNSGAQELKVGTSDGSSIKAYSFLKFDGFNTQFPASKISSVQLHLFDFWAWSCTAAPFSVNKVTQSWTLGGVTSYPGPSFDSTPLGSVTADPGAACTNTGHNVNTGTWMVVPLAAPLFNSWAKGGTNYGLAITASQSVTQQWKQFASSNVAGREPFLTVTYVSNAPPVVDHFYPPANYASPTLTPELLAVGTDPDNFPGTAPVNYDFRIFTVDANGILTKIHDSGWIAKGDYQVPAGLLQWGKTYFWQPVSGDGSIASDVDDPAANLVLMSTVVPQPFLTSQLAQNGGHGFSAAAGNYTTSATDAQVSTVGPPLVVVRDYNSRDPRLSGGFGGGWSSTVDSKARVLANGNVVVTYPDGSEVEFGKNSDGSFTPPSGRFSTLKTLTSPAGIQLTDKNSTVYTFRQLLSTGVYGLTLIADAANRTQTLTYTSGHVTTITSTASGRSLFFAWTTPSGATSPHVATVTTDPVTAGSPSTALVWTYTYSGDKLTTVCPPTSTTACTTYAYTAASAYPNTVVDLSPHSYWRFADLIGTATPFNTILLNNTDGPATYNNVTLGQPGPLPGSSGTAAGFNGTSSFVALPGKIVTGASVQTISMWFKTTVAGGVLFAYSLDPVTQATSTGSYTPALYIGTDGKLRGEFWNGTAAPITSAGTVTDGVWHQVILAGLGGSQTMYLDGAKVNATPLAGTIQVPNNGANNVTVGAGFLGGSWPSQPHTGATGYATFFGGSISDVAFLDRGIDSTEADALWASGHSASQLLTTVTRPSGRIAAQVTYDTLTGVLATVTDENGGLWQIGTPQVSASSQAYASAVLANRPVDFWRLNDTVGATTAGNMVNGGTATYHSMTLGDPGPFLSDSTSAQLDGSAGYLSLPSGLISASGNQSLSLWFRTTTPGGVLFSYQGAGIGAGSTTGNYTPAIYVGVDGKLRGQFWDGNLAPITSAASVADGNWHFVVLAANGLGQNLYLDGDLVGSKSNAVGVTGQNNVYIGVGYMGGSWPSNPWQGQSTAHPDYFTGNIADVVLYRSQLPADAVNTLYTAYAGSGNVDSPGTQAILGEFVTVTGPGGKTTTDVFDPQRGLRRVAHTNELGTTRYGYDSRGFLLTTTDPNGNTVTTGHDPRGNIVSRIMCQDQSHYQCSTEYFTYYPNDTSATLTPDPRNDMLLTARDGRSSSATDNTYLTSYTYDTAGNRTAVTTPAVTGFASGRTTTTTYTDGTSVAAYDTLMAPAGLVNTATTPGKSTQRNLYYHNGDTAQTTDALGQVTRYTYDNLGRPLTITVISDVYPSGLTTTFTYDKLGEVVTATQPAIIDRVTGATHTACMTNTFDADGNVLTQTVSDLTGGDAPRTSTMAYNDHGQLASVTDPANTGTSSYGYDAYGNTNVLINPLGEEVDYTFDSLGNVLTATLRNYVGDPQNPSPATDVVMESRAYDPAGRLASITDAMGWVTSYQYYDNNLLYQVTRTDPIAGSSYIVSQDTYDNAGDKTISVTNNGMTTTAYTVDAANRNVTATIDAAGVNRSTTLTYTPDDGLQTATFADGSGVQQVSEATYDPMGHMTSRVVHGSALTPAGRWALTDGSGTTANDSYGNDHATAAAVTWSAAHGGSAAFTTSSPPLTTARPVLDTTGSFAVSAWVYLTSTAATAVAVSQDATQQSGFDLRYDKTANKWAFVRATTDVASPTLVKATSTAAPTLNTWTHLVGVYNADTGSMKLYVNGSSQGSATDSTPIASNGALTIGRGRSGAAAANPFVGSLSDVQVYDQTLTAAQVTNVYNGTVPAAGTLAIKTSWTYDQRGLPTSETDPNGNTTLYTYDEAGRVAVTISPTVNVESGGGAPVATHPITTVGYDTFGAIVETSDANGRIITIGYDADGRPVTSTLPNYTPPGTSTPITASVTNTYNAAGQLTTTRDPLGHDTSYTYDQLGRTVTVTEPNGAVSHATYDLLGDVLSTTDPTGAVRQATYDYLSRQLTATNIVRQPSSIAYTTTYAYNTTGGWLSAITSPGGSTVGYGYNAVGEATSVTDGANNTTTYAYGFAGQLTQLTYPDGKGKSGTYDAALRLTSISQLDGTGTPVATATRSYDPLGNVTALTDPNTHTSTFTYDAGSRLTAQVQPVSAGASITTSFGYDAVGNRTRATDGRGNPVITTYNAWNLPESVIEPATTAYPNAIDRTFTTSYNAAGWPVTQLQPGGVTTTNSYDVVGNVTGQSGTGAEAATTSRTYGYDLAGRLTSASAPGGDDTFTWDDRGELLTTAGPSGTSSFTYNADGLTATRTDAAGATTFTYDPALRLSTITNPTSSVSATYTYTNTSQLQRISYTSGDSHTFTYNSRHLLTSDTLTTSGGATIASVSYGWDLNGNETSKTTTGIAGAATNTYTYDWANRLTSWNNGTTTTGYAYDNSGNRTQNGGLTYTYDARNQLLTGGASTYTYTPRGTLQTKTTGATPTNTTNDAFNQTITSGTQTYNYDALGRLVAATGVTGLTYTGLDNTLAADSIAAYTRDPFGELVAETSGTTSLIAWRDLHGDVIAQHAPAGTTLAGSRTYDPLGKITNTTTIIGSLGYQSGWTDTTNNTVNMAARWYDTNTGQFTNRDTANNNPTPNPTNANPYAYGNQNPLTNSDPSGHFSLCTNSGDDIAIGCYHSDPPPPVPTEPHCGEYGVGTGAGCSPHYVSAGGHCGVWGSGTDFGCSHPVSDVPEPCAHDKDGHDVYDCNRNPCPVTESGQPNYLTNCTTIKVYADGTTVIDNNWFKTADLQGVDPYDVARKVDEAKDHAVGDTWRVDPSSFTAYILIDAINAAAQEEADLAAQKKANECQASFWCRHATAIGIAAAIGVGLLCFATAGWTGIGAVGCGALAGAVGGAVTGALRGDSVPQIILETLIGGIIGAATAGIGTKLFGALTESLVGPLATASEQVIGKIFAGAIAGGLAGGIGAGAQYGAECATRLRHGCTIDGAAAAANAGALAGAALGGLAGAAEAVPCHSFDGATPVLLADGTTKPIKDIQLGERVRTTNPETGIDTTQPVVALHDNRDTDLADITIKNDGAAATDTIHTTAHHLFWDATTSQWTDAKNLTPGHSLRALNGTIGATIISVKTWTGLHHMQDLTIAGTHTYFVVVGGRPVLVHNCPSGNVPAPSMATKKYGPMPQAGRRGSTATRNQLDDVRDEMLAANPDWIHSAGGRSAFDGSKLRERAVFNPSGPGRRFPDLTFDLPDGTQFYVNTVDTYRNGAATTRELAAALDITMWGSGPVLMIPKL